MHLKIIPLGGLGEIGLNMMIFEYGTTLFIVDAGLMFPEDYMLGVDYVIPDMDYVKKNRSLISGIVLTHAHEDHIGALPFLLKEVNAPVFGTPFTLGVVKHKLEEFDVMASSGLHEIHPDERLKLGPFVLEFIRVGHSVVDGVGIAIQTPYGLILHTGDFKISHSIGNGLSTNVGRFAQCGEKGVLALLSDSTNIEKEGYTISARAISQKLARIVDESRGRIIIALFASNINRI
ncbi:MAG: ribonuclease J, partial [Desulfobacterales bacterium]